MPITSKNDEKPCRTKHGFRHVFFAGIYSFDGLKRMIQETAFRHEIVGFGIVLILFAWVDVPIINYLISLILFLILIAFEAVNTGLENIVDELSPDVSDFGKQTKDLGSFAVFCLLLANGIFTLYAVAGAVFY